MVVGGPARTAGAVSFLQSGWESSRPLRSTASANLAISRKLFDFDIETIGSHVQERCAIASSHGRWRKDDATTPSVFHDRKPQCSEMTKFPLHNQRIRRALFDVQFKYPDRTRHPGSPAEIFQSAD